MIEDIQRHALGAVVGELAAATRAVALPDPLLPGWQSACAAEYANAVTLLHGRVGRLEAVLGQATALLGL